VGGVYRKQLENSSLALVCNSGDKLKYRGGGWRTVNPASICRHTSFGVASGGYSSCSLHLIWLPVACHFKTILIS